MRALNCKRPSRLRRSLSLCFSFRCPHPQGREWEIKRRSQLSYCQMLGVGSSITPTSSNLEHVYSGLSQRAGSAPTK